MSRKPATARHRTDTGSAELIELLRASGVEYEPLGGAIDGVAWYRGVVRLIDFKASWKARYTKNQGKLLARECPISFLFDRAQIPLLVSDMKAEARRWPTMYRLE